MPGSPEYKAAHQRQAAARQQHQHQLHQQHMAQASSAQAGAQGPGQGASLHPAPADWAAAHVAPAGPAATPTLAGEARRLLWSWLVASGVVCVASTATYPLGEWACLSTLCLLLQSMLQASELRAVCIRYSHIPNHNHSMPSRLSLSPQT